MIINHNVFCSASSVNNNSFTYFAIAPLKAMFNLRAAAVVVADGGAVREAAVVVRGELPPLLLVPRPHRRRQVLDNRTLSD